MKMFYNTIMVNCLLLVNLFSGFVGDDTWHINLYTSLNTHIFC